MALMAALASSCALAAYGFVGDSNDPVTAARWVKITNTYRCMHGVGKVGWTQAASDDAQKYVDTLSTELINSNSLCLSSPAGPAQENLAKGYSNLEDAVANWYSEGGHCVDQQGCTPPGNQGRETRHYTALVWKGVTQIGCAINSTTSIYICRYRSGDSLGPQTANMPMFFRDSVYPQLAGEAGSFDKCSSDSTGALNPSLPDPASLYPNVPNVGDAMSWVTCPGGAAPGGNGQKVRERHQWIAFVITMVLALCCIGFCCYSCRFIKEKKMGKMLPGTLAEMSEKHHKTDHEDWRYDNYHDSEEARLTQYSGKETRKDFAKGADNSGVPGGGLVSLIAGGH